jgi:hypothetical protein
MEYEHEINKIYLHWIERPLYMLFYHLTDGQRVTHPEESSFIEQISKHVEMMYFKMQKDILY